MNLIANSTGGTLASAIAARLSFATMGIEAGMDLLAQGYAALSQQNSAVVPKGAIDAFASEGAALEIDDSIALCSSSFSDFALFSAEEASYSYDTTSYVSPANAQGKTKVPTKSNSSDSSTSVGSHFTVNGIGSAISRELRTETADPSSDGVDMDGTGEGMRSNRVLQSAERFARLQGTDSSPHFEADEVGFRSLITSDPVVWESKPAKAKAQENAAELLVENPKAEFNFTTSIVDLSAIDSDVDIVRSASEPKSVAIPKTKDLGSEIFVGARTRAGRIHRAEAREAILKHLIAHLSPASLSIIARENVSLTPSNGIVYAFSASPGPTGTTNISLTVAPRGSERPSEIYFTESDGRIEFAGIEGGRAMGATQPLPASLPIPTFSPAGILRDGMVEPGYGLPGRAPHDRGDRDESEAELEERIASMVLDQLRKGPDSSSAANLLTKLNNYLVNNGLASTGQAITPAAWIRMIRRALGLVVRSAPIFDAKGLRTVEAIRHDVSAIAGMGVSTLRAWDNAFDTDLLSEQLFRTPEASDESVEASMTERLESGLKRRLPHIAREAVSSDFVDPAIGFAGEANLQWGIAVIGAMEGIELKVRAAMDFLSSVYRKNPKAACKGMALIIKHSTVSERNLAEHPLFDRWSEAEVRSLIASTMRSEMWEIMSQRAMRKHFSEEPRINSFLNEVIFNANYSKAIEDLNRIDVTKVSDEVFWDAVEQTGAEETLMDNVIARMAQFN